MKTANLREAYGRALAEAGEANPAIVALEADLGKSTRSILFGERFPERYFQMGIAEAGMASTAAGLALAGKIPFIHSFAVFASGRCYDQLRSSICLSAVNVKICGSSCGLSDFGDGKTHQGIEDVALMRALPNMTVIVPADAPETAQAVAAAVAHRGPVYLRINRNDLPVLTEGLPPFVVGAPRVVRQYAGSSAPVAIVANGVMLARALEAAERLEREGVSARVVNLSTVKPLAPAALLASLGDARRVVTAEEHTVIGGTGSAVAEALAPLGIPIQMVGIRDSFGISAASYDEILAHFGLTADAIVEAARRLLAGPGGG